MTDDNVGRYVKFYDFAKYKTRSISFLVELQSWAVYRNKAENLLQLTLLWIFSAYQRWFAKV